MSDPFSLFEQQAVITGEALPDRERPLYPDSVLPGKEINDQATDRKPMFIVGGIAALALAVAIYAAVKK